MVEPVDPKDKPTDGPVWTLRTQAPAQAPPWGWEQSSCENSGERATPTSGKASLPSHPPECKRRKWKTSLPSSTRFVPSPDSARWSEHRTPARPVLPLHLPIDPFEEAPPFRRSATERGADEECGDDEPSLGATTPMNQARTWEAMISETDVELDESDLEPSLGAPERHPPCIGISAGDAQKLGRWLWCGREEHVKHDGDGGFNDSSVTSQAWARRRRSSWLGAPLQVTIGISCTPVASRTRTLNGAWSMLSPRHDTPR
jgi:hypothetical protein